jgi:hypothetical protein
MKVTIKKLEKLKLTALDLFELNCINRSIESVQNGQIDKLINEVDHEIKNYQHYSNYLFFTELKNAIKI